MQLFSNLTDVHLESNQSVKIKKKWKKKDKKKKKICLRVDCIFSNLFLLCDSSTNVQHLARLCTSYFQKWVFYKNQWKTRNHLE